MPQPARAGVNQHGHLILKQAQPLRLFRIVDAIHRADFHKMIPRAHGAKLVAPAVFGVVRNQRGGSLLQLSL